MAASTYLTVFPNVASGGDEDVLVRRIYITSVKRTYIRIWSPFRYLNRTDSVSNVSLQDFPASFTLTENYTVSNKVIQIAADFPVSVHTLSYKNGTYQKACESYYNLPIAQLSKKYILITTRVTPQFSVIGTADNTNVEIVLRNRAAPFNISLNKLEVYTYFLNNIFSFNVDMTGSIVTSDKNVAVISGGFFASIPPARDTANSPNTLQLPGVSEWSTSCILSPFIPRRRYWYKLVASENDTHILFSADRKLSNHTIQRAEKIEPLHTESDPVFVTAMKPVLVVMFSQGNLAEGSTIDDSSMVQCIYLTNYVNRATFFVPANFYSFLRIIIRFDYI